MHAGLNRSLPEVFGQTDMALLLLLRRKTMVCVVCDVEKGANEPGGLQEYTREEVDAMIRDPNISRAEIAAKLGCTATGMYLTLREQAGVRVGSLSFLVDVSTESLLSPITEEDIAAAIRAAVSRGRTKRLTA